MIKLKKYFEMLNDFPWGKIVKVHSIGDIDIIEYIEGRRFNAGRGKITEGGTTEFYPYIDGRDTNTSYLTLDRAIVGALGRKYDGANSQAADYFFKMVGMAVLPEKIDNEQS